MNPIHRALARRGTLRLALALAAGLTGTAQGGAGEDVDISQLPPPADRQADFVRDIQPILQASCLRCHTEERSRGQFSLSSREAALKGGRRGIDIIPGQSAQSPLIHYVAGLVEGMVMPPKSQGGPLPPEQVSLLRAWIDQGALWTSPPPAAPPGPRLSISPTLRWTSVAGDEHRFREHYWTHDGFTGGLDSFELEQRFDRGRRVVARGRVLAPQEDYKLVLEVAQRDLGFVRAGFEQYRKYYDNSGGYYRPFDLPPLTLDRELHLDLGKAWIEAGLNTPGWPLITLGYEFQYKDGAKSTLQWGDVTNPAGLSRKIAPAYKTIDEQVHILKLDLVQDFRGTLIEDSFRAEWYDLDNRRYNTDAQITTKPGPDKKVDVLERYDHFQAANMFRLERQVTDWLLASVGYLYTHLDGNAGWNLNTYLTPFAALPPVTGFGFDKFWFSQSIVLEQQSHAFNANAQLGPWNGLSLHAGIQSEWMSQHGAGQVRLDEGDPNDPANFLLQPALLSSDLDRFTLDENLGLRYTRIPYTILFAEGRFQQESLGQFEEQFGGRHDFLQDTDATGALYDGRAGFSISPWQKVALNSHYRYRVKETDFDHKDDMGRFGGVAFPMEGYPAFIRWRETSTDEVETKLVYRPVHWIKGTLSHRLRATDYRTRTDPVSGGVSPGGDLFAGNEDAHIYSLNLTVTPWRRFYVSTTFSYRDTRTATAQNGIPQVVSYEGDLYSVLTSAHYILSPVTDLEASYTFSRANYGQDHAEAGLPLGIDYDWHGLLAGLTRRFERQHLTAKLQYGFFSYSESSSAHYNDYTAHAVFLTMIYHWPNN